MMSRSDIDRLESEGVGTLVSEGGRARVVGHLVVNTLLRSSGMQRALGLREESSLPDRLILALAF